MNLDLKDKVVIVTGGAKGIGEGIVRQLAVEGAVPVIVGRNKADNLQLQKELEAMDQRALAVTAELTRPEECARAVEKVIELTGRIDGLVNNAGVNDGIGLEKGSYEGFMESLHRNLVHYYLMAHHALPELIRN